MNEKVVFVDRSSSPGSVVKILARNVLALTKEIDIKVIKLEDLKNYNFTDEKIALIDPIIPLNDSQLSAHIPRRVNVIHFKIASYTTMDGRAVIDQIKNSL